MRLGQTRMQHPPRRVFLWLAPSCGGRVQGLNELTSRSLLLGGELGQRCIAVDVIETNCEAESSSEFDQAARHIRRQRLPALVIGHIALSAPKSDSHRLLGFSEPPSD